MKWDGKIFRLQHFLQTSILQRELSQTGASVIDAGNAIPFPVPKLNKGLGIELLSASATFGDHFSCAFYK